MFNAWHINGGTFGHPHLYESDGQRCVLMLMKKPLKRKGKWESESALKRVCEGLGQKQKNNVSNGKKQQCKTEPKRKFTRRGQKQKEIGLKGEASGGK